MQGERSAQPLIRQESCVDALYQLAADRCRKAEIAIQRSEVGALKARSDQRGALGSRGRAGPGFVQQAFRRDL